MLDTCETTLLYTVISFYKFLDLEDLPGLKASLIAYAEPRDIAGTVLIAPEGINASLSGSAEALAAFVDDFKGDPRFADIQVKISVGETKPFHKLLIRIKPWIIRFAESDDPSVAEAQAGKRLTPRELHELIKTKPDNVIIVDTRNDYEFAYGTFEGARTLPIRRFTEFPKVFKDAFADQQDKTFVFFCTGGVRCEKVVPWAEREGFKNAYQLDGGILSYFEQEGRDGFNGDCFVFDERWLLQPELTERPGRERPGHYPKGHKPPEA